jgi:Tfp pilus assembly protein PilO
MSDENKKSPLQKLTNKKEEQGKKRINIDMAEFKETLINYIVPLVSVLLIILILVFVLYPSYKNLPDLQAEVGRQTALRDNLQEKLNNLNRLVDFESVVSENSDLVNKVLVSEELVPGLLTQVDRISRESGLTVTRLNYGLGAPLADQSAGDINYKYVTVNLGVSGSFDQMVTFLNNLENAARVINVDQMRYSISEVTDTPKLGINFVLVSPYIYVESTAVTDDPIDLDISDPQFVDLINKIKAMKYYDPNAVDQSVPVEEAPPEEQAGQDQTADTGNQEATQPTPDQTSTDQTSQDQTSQTQPSETSDSSNSIFPQ